MEEYPIIKTFYAKFSNQMKALFQQFCTVMWNKSFLDSFW